MDLRGKRLLLLGGSRITCEIVRHARKMGIITGVTDWYPIEKSPAKQMADEAYFVSTSDITAMSQLIREQKFDGVLTGFTDSVLPYYAEMCDACQLPCYGTKEQFELLIDKEKYKALLRKFEIPTIPEYRIDPNDVEGSARNIQFPVLVKPADSSGARGITVCRSIGELKSAIAAASDASKRKKVLVEQYIDGEECTVFWLFQNGEYHIMLHGDRHMKSSSKGKIPLPVGYTYPSVMQEAFAAETAPKVKKMFRSIDIRNGMLFMQCKVAGGRCLVYDIGYRLTGTLEYINLREICGYDPMDMLITFALTGDMGEPELDRKLSPNLHGVHAFNVSILSRPGKIAKIKGIEAVKAMPDVFDVVIAHPEGEEITEKMDGLLSQITVRVLGKSENVEQMRKTMKHIHDTIEILSDKGDNLALPGMEDSDFVKLSAKRRMP